jgi:hypothetical protein
VTSDEWQVTSPLRQPPTRGGRSNRWGEALAEPRLLLCAETSSGSGESPDRSPFVTGHWSLVTFLIPAVARLTPFHGEADWARLRIRSGRFHKAGK